MNPIIQARRSFPHFNFFLFGCLSLCVAEFSPGQGKVNWLSSGSLQNWFSEKGWEIEEGNVREQQYGLRWPAQYNRQDNQAAKGFWIGVKNFTDQNGLSFSEKVVHVGPRVAGDGEFFPMQFELFAKFEPPSVVVDGIPSSRGLEDIKTIDPTLKADRSLVTLANTAIGVTVTRKIYQFSQQYHDNYHVFEMTFKNTGYIDGTNVQKLNQTLTGVYFYYQFRYSVCNEIRYVVNNSAGWGINTMNDARGYPPDASHPPTDIKCQFSWHGHHSQANRPFAAFDNIGAPIWNPSQSNGYVPPSDTTWRLGGAQFVGNAHIYAPTSALDTTSSAAQPSTTNYVASDDPVLTQRNSQYNTAQMTAEYTKMSEGHTARHAWLVEPSGNFSQQTVMANINSPIMGDGSPGGFSSAVGYGPYTLAPGQSVTIVFVEAVNGLSRDEAVRIGRRYKNGTITAAAKNDSVFLGRNRLFTSFRRAVANYQSGYSIPQPPYPPAGFTINSGGDRISLQWTASPNEAANGFRGYRLYRAEGKADSTYRVLFECGPGTPNPQVVYSFDDVTALRGLDYYYYITSFGDPGANTGAGMTPVGSLESSRFYTQTYTPAQLRRPAGRPAERARDTLDIVSKLVDGLNTVEFEYANNVAGAADGFSVVQFYVKLIQKKNKDSTNVRVDSVSPPASMFPLKFTSVGSRQSLTFNLTIPQTDSTFNIAYYQMKLVDVIDPGMVRVLFNTSAITTPSTIVSPYRTRGDAIRIVPNPYSISADERLRFPGDRIAFFNIPGNCSIKIFTELGELIYEIDHNDGTGDAYWNSITSSGQVVVSGVYIIVVEDRDRGERYIKKFVVIR